MAKSVKKGDVIVAGTNFGCGSSREHAPRSLLQAGMDCVVAESFARIFYRNSINVGLLPVQCKIEAAEGDMLSVDVDQGVVKNETTGTEWNFDPVPAVRQGPDREGRPDGQDQGGKEMYKIAVACRGTASDQR